MTSDDSPALTRDEQAVLDGFRPAQTLLSVMAPIIGVLNFGGSVVAGIWLAILGEWGAIGTGLLSLFAASFLLGIALMPAMIFLPLQLRATKTNNKALMQLSSLASMGYTFLIASAWSAWAFSHFVKGTHAAALIPATLWAYSVATSPWVYMASKEQDNISTVIGAFFIQLTAIVLGIGFIFFKFDYGTAFSVAACILTVCAFYQSSLAMKMIAVMPKEDIY
jgi:hypothetical protein